ncbi:ComF family protein [uncultured Slackia sp.]|uniref:ComF family protein n=1 Tax=uncultured Slackia sp. TaxID=665903 RepID=UPI0026DFF8D9|nr:ComF family protein [uncultured Slackia sp.]
MPSFLTQAFCETLWPTRCALCDAAGVLLCESCLRNLRYVDFYQACPACGAPWGRIQCDTCNAVAVEHKPLAAPCATCLEYDDAAAAVVKTYKDKGEQRLGPLMASMMARIVQPSWVAWAQAVTYVPATPDAVRRRGFDHARFLADAFAHEVGLPCIGLVEQAGADDQRALGRRQRAANIAGRFRAPRAAGFDRVIAVDDVTTTGATLAGIQDALARVQCASRLVTFARV